jgi:hypothetical protein
VAAALRHTALLLPQVSVILVNCSGPSRQLLQLVAALLQWVEDHAPPTGCVLLLAAALLLPLNRTGGGFGACFGRDPSHPAPAIVGSICVRHSIIVL